MGRIAVSVFGSGGDYLPSAGGGGGGPIVQTLVKSLAAIGAESQVITVSANALIVVQVCVRQYNGGTSTSLPEPTMDAVAMDVARDPTAVNIFDNGLGASIWYEENVSAGAKTIAFDGLGADANEGLMLIHEVQGAFTSGALDVTQQARDDSTTSVASSCNTGNTANAKTIAFSNLSVGGYDELANLAITDPPSGAPGTWTTLNVNQDASVNLAWLFAWAQRTSIGAYVAGHTWTSAGNQSVQAVASFKLN